MATFSTRVELLHISDFSQVFAVDHLVTACKFICSEVTSLAFLVLCRRWYRCRIV